MVFALIQVREIGFVKADEHVCKRTDAGQTMDGAAVWRNIPAALGAERRRVHVASGVLCSNKKFCCQAQFFNLNLTGRREKVV